MLSGFVLTHARLKSKNLYRHDKAILFVRKRTATVYPLYAFGIGLALIINWWRDYTLPEWYELVAQGFFLQSWLPWLPERTVQVHCWFLSAMLPYWLSYDVFLHQIIYRITEVRRACLILILLTLPPWLLFIFPSSFSGGDPQWYSTHKTGSLTSATDFGVVILKFHPICYVHVFIFGMVLARLRQLVAEKILMAAEGMNVQQGTLGMAGVLERLFRFGATIGYFGLLLVFNVKELRPASHKLSARLSILMLLQGLVLVGLAPISNPAVCNNEEVKKYSFAYYVTKRRLRDPVEWLFSHAPATWGNLSYAQYVLQFVAYSLWPVKSLGPGDVVLFFMFLLSMSQVCCLLIALPASGWWTKARPSRIASVPCIVALIGAGLCAINRNFDRGGSLANVDGCGHPITQAVLPPAYVHVADEARDVRLNWTAKASDFAVPRTLINPSVLWSEGRLLRAARAHAITCAANRSFTYEGKAATELTTTWHSDIVLDDGEGEGHDNGIEAWASWDVDRWGLDGTAPLRRLRTSHDSGPLLSTRCGDATSWQPTNNTLLRKRVFGAEDPKLFMLPSASGSADSGASSAESGAGSAESGAGSADSGATSPGFASSAESGAGSAESGAGSANSGATSPGFASVGIAFSRLTCQQVGEKPQYGMFQIVGQVDLSSEAGTFGARASLLPCGEDDGRDEKNWIAFRQGDMLRYVYSINPHVVKTVNATSSECSLEPDVKTDQRTDKTDLGQGSKEAFEALTSLAPEGGAVRLHGSGTSVRWSKDLYLNLFHTKDGTDRYVTMAYLMSATFPFAITNVSRPLPLQGGNASFASSLALSPGGSKVVVGYGVADTEARALVMSRDYVASLFSWQDACTSPAPTPLAGARPSCDYSLVRGRDACSLATRTFIAAGLILFGMLCYICSSLYVCSRRDEASATSVEPQLKVISESYVHLQLSSGLHLAPTDEAKSRGLDANKASAAADDTDNSGPIARAHQSVFEAFALPGLRDTAVLLRKFSSKRNSKGTAEPASPVHLDSAASVSDELAAVLLDDGSVPIGMTPEDATALEQMRRASAEQVVAPLQREGTAREALKAAESGLSSREMRQQRSYNATLAAAEAVAVTAAVEGAEEAAEETSETPSSTGVSSVEEPPPPKVVTSVALASLSESEPLGEESVAPQLPQPVEAKDEYKSMPFRVELGRSSSPTNTVNSSACSEAPKRRRRKKKTSVPDSPSGDQATETALAERSIAEASQSSDANVVPVAKTRRRRTKKMVKERDPYSDDPYAVELDPTELDL